MKPEPDELTTFFAELRRHAAHTFTAPDTTDIYHQADARTARTRRFSVTAALLAASALLTASMVLQAAPPATEQEPTASGQAWLPQTQQPWTRDGEAWIPPAAPPQRSATPAATRADLANQVRFLNNQKTTQLRNTTITLPPWPTGAQGCPAGTYTFHDGKAPTGEPDPIGRPNNYLILYRSTLGIYANLDGRPGDEMVIPIACGFAEVTYQLLVVKEDPANGPQAFAYLPALPAFDRFYQYDTGLVVEILNNPFDTIAEQRRRYTWNGTAFVQTHGPTAFPADLYPDPRSTDPRQSYFRTDLCGGGILSFMDGVSGTWPDQNHPATRFELGETSTGQLGKPAEPVSKGDALITVTCKPEGRPWQVWVVNVNAAKATPILKVGDDGVTAIVSHRITNGLAEVVVRIQARQQIWRYRSDGSTFTRIP